MHTFIKHLATLFFYILLATELHAQVASSDSLALVDLYNSTNGQNWTKNSNWLTTKPVSKWFGITVLNGRVTQIYLNGNNLTGGFPSSVGNLTQLSSLDLGSNGLTGSISELDSLSNLIELILRWTNLSGTIPKSFKNLKRLQYVDLANSKFSGDFFVFGDLIQLDLSNNHFSGTLPEEIGTLVHLTQLNLRQNNFTGSIPVSIGNINHLQSLDLSVNKFSDTIPNELTNLTELDELYLDYNDLVGRISPLFGKFKKLQNLILSSNHLTGEIPSELGSLSNLFGLGLDHNNLSGSIPSSLGNLNLLQYLGLSNNNLTDSIPAALGTLSKLQSLNVSHNNLTGRIPSTFVNFKNHTPIAATGIDLSYNHISSLPDLSIYRDSFYFNVINNNLTFGSLEPNIPLFNFFYSPQDSVPLYYQLEGSYYKLWVSVEGKHNFYRWFKNDIPLSGKDSTISISFLDTLSSYRCEITNSLVTGLTLYTLLPIQEPPSVNDNDSTSIESFFLQPSVVTNEATLFFMLRTGGDSKIELYDAVGHAVKIIDLNFRPPGKYTENISFRDYPSGFYMVILVVGSSTRSCKIILSR